MTKLRNNPRCSAMFTWLLYVTTASVFRAHAVSHASPDCSASSIRPQSAPSAPGQDNVGRQVRWTRCLGIHTSSPYLARHGNTHQMFSRSAPPVPRLTCQSQGCQVCGGGGRGGVNVHTGDRYLHHPLDLPANSSSGSNTVRRDAAFPWHYVFEVENPHLQPVHTPEHEPRIPI